VTTKYPGKAGLATPQARVIQATMFANLTTKTTTKTTADAGRFWVRAR
jgi:hypothetical protein